ncbi:MAG: hypothetical protein IPP40_04280 [bacterium]|nr:hypothetical protein [bacterium]
MIWLFALLVSCSGLLAQTSLRAEADSLFYTGDYERVELLVLRASRNAEIPDSQRVALELLGGYSLIMLQREAEARSHFQRALELDSTLVLDPVQVSPKFRIVFDDVKSEWQASRIQSIPTARVKEVTVWKGASIGSHLLNFAVPGTGFLNEKKYARGIIHFAAQAALTVLWLDEVSQNNSARKDYLAADSSSQAETLYNTYDDHHRRMWTFGLAAAGIYLASQVDLTLFRTPKTSFEVLPAESALRLKVNF